MKLSDISKPWFRSKKFMAFLLMEILLSALAVFALTTQPDLGWPLSAFMTAIVLTMGAVAFGFNGQQASLDKYLQASFFRTVYPAQAPTTEISDPKDEEGV
jgi:hypothetical protein